MPSYPYIVWTELHSGFFCKTMYESMHIWIHAHALCCYRFWNAFYKQLLTIRNSLLVPNVTNSYISLSILSGTKSQDTALEEVSKQTRNRQTKRCTANQDINLTLLLCADIKLGEERTLVHLIAVHSVYFHDICFYFLGQKHSSASSLQWSYKHLHILTWGWGRALA